MKNPYVRLRELCGISQKAFLEKYGFGKIVMVYVEAGTYPSISDRLNAAIAQECQEKGVDGRTILKSEYGVDSLEAAYHLWQKLQREEVAEDFRLGPPFEWDTEESPFSRWAIATGGSIQGFCKKLKVPPATVTRYARGETKAMPKIVQDVLEEVEFPHLIALTWAQAKWFER